MKTKTCGACKYHINECHCRKFECYAGKNDFCDEFEPKEPKVITNGDLIRQMSNEELAAWDKCDWCVLFDGMLCHKKDDQCCADGIKPYLDAPAESEVDDE